MSFRFSRVVWSGHMSCCAVIGLLLTGCAHQPSAQERSLGEAVRQALSQQSAAPAKGPASIAPATTEGVIAVHGMDRYHRSWIQPPQPVNALNLQSGGSGMTSPSAR